MHHDKLSALLPIPGGELELCDWAVGVTSAPRREPTVGATMASLRRCGLWPARVFSEEGVELDRDWPSSIRSPKLGAWCNFILGLHELYLRNPRAGCYLMVQDDVVFSGYDLGSYLNGSRWPDDTGMISLYCSSSYTKDEFGWHRFDGQWLWGALALAFPRSSIPMLLSSTQALTHHFQHADNRVDLRLGAVMKAYGLSVYFPTPSLAQHIGRTSAIWSERASCTGPRVANSFLE